MIGKDLKMLIQYSCPLLSVQEIAKAEDTIMSNGKRVRKKESDRSDRDVNQINRTVNKRFVLSPTRQLWSVRKKERVWA